MRTVRTRVTPAILSLFFLMTAFTPTAFAAGGEYVTITVTPAQEYYDIEDDEDAEKDVIFVMEAQDLDGGEQYKLRFELVKTSTQESMISNTYGNTYRSLRMDQFGVDWEEDTEYTLIATLQLKDDQGVFNAIDNISFSFTIGEDPGTGGSGTTEPVIDHRDNLTGHSEWEYGLTIENNQLNATIIMRQWLDATFWDKLDENNDGVTLDSEVRSYTAAQNAAIGIEDIESPVLSVGDGPIGWATTNFDLTHTITDDGRDLFAEWTVTTNSTTISGTSLSFLIEMGENDTRLADQFGLVIVHLESVDWGISSVSTFHSTNDNMEFLQKQSESEDYWSSEKAQGDPLPDFKVVMSSVILGTESNSEEPTIPAIDRLPDCQLRWNLAGQEESNLITEELTGNFDLELETGSYELVFQCDDQDGDPVEMRLVFGYVILTVTDDQITHECAFIVSDNMTEALHFSISWTSNGTSGQLGLDVQESNRPVLILPDGKELPGFTSVLATLGLLGAAFIRRN